MENNYKPFAQFHLRDKTVDELDCSSLIKTDFIKTTMSFNDKFVKELFNILQNDPEFKDCTDVVAISLPMFKRYILETLPKWLEEHQEK